MVNHMTPFLLFLYLTACAGGLFVVGGVLFVLGLAALWIRGVIAGANR